MEELTSDWYKQIWSLDIKNASWVEDTERQVDFLLKTMALNGSERILDLACGFGRHSIALARRGFRVTGVDITPVFIEDARKTADFERLDVTFICSDIRDTCFDSEFDVVINMADGAIGYLEDDSENLKIFDKISDALKPGGKHFMDVCSRDHAEMYFPEKSWEIGAKSLALSDFSWDRNTNRMLYWGWDIPYGEPAAPPIYIRPATGPRLYNKEELRCILFERGMTIQETYSDYLGNTDSYKKMQLMVYSKKTAV